MRNTDNNNTYFTTMYIVSSFVVRSSRSYAASCSHHLRVHSNLGDSNQKLRDLNSADEPSLSGVKIWIVSFPHSFLTARSAMHHTLRLRNHLCELKKLEGENIFLQPLFLEDSSLVDQSMNWAADTNAFKSLFCILALPLYMYQRMLLTMSYEPPCHFTLWIG